MRRMNGWSEPKDIQPQGPPHRQTHTSFSFLSTTTSYLRPSAAAAAPWGCLTEAKI